MSNRKVPTPRLGTNAKLEASERHNERFFQERKALAAKNLARSLELKALRLQKQALEKAAAPPAARRTKRAAPSS